MDSSPSEKSEKPYFSNENDMKKTCVSASRTMSGNSHNIVHKLFHREVSPSKINLGLFTRLNTLFFCIAFETPILPVDFLECMNVWELPLSKGAVCYSGN